MNITSQPYYQRLGFKTTDYTNTNAVSDQSISLPLFPYITKEQQDYVIAVVIEAL